MYLYMHTTQQTEELTYYVLRESQYLAHHQAMLVSTPELGRTDMLYIILIK